MKVFRLGGVPRPGQGGALTTFDVHGFGARGDGRADDTAAINRAFAAAGEAGAGVVHFPPGRYLVGSAPRLAGTALALEGARDVSVLGYGATLLQGPAALRTLGIFGCERVRISGLRFVGCTAHAGERYFENSAAITVNYGSRFIVIEDCAVTNYLGDCIYVGGTLTNGGGTGKESRHVLVSGCTLKSRYGDGERIYAGGSGSRLAVAVVDAVGVQIRGNLIFGGVGLEPNLNGQHLVNCLVEDNQFLEGPVLPQRSIGRAHHHDEPLVPKGTPDSARIAGGVSLGGIPGEPVVVGNVIRGNTFDLGMVSVQNPYVGHVIDNLFRIGQVVVGARSGPNYTSGVTVRGNRTERVPEGETNFIKLAGLVANCCFLENILDDESKTVIGSDGPDTGDLGRCVFRGNVNTGRFSGRGGAALGFTPAGTSISEGNWHPVHAPPGPPRAQG